MSTTIDEVGDRIYRISTFVEAANLPFNQYLIDADEPLLFHTGLRALFPDVRAAIDRVLPTDRLRWVSFGHFEADECGALNQWLTSAPRAEAVHGTIGVLVSLGDQADRPPRPLADGETLELGGRRVRWIDTPQVPHGWDAGLMYEEVTGTLFAGDLFTTVGACPAHSDQSIVEPAAATEDLFHATALTPATAPTIRRLAELDPSMLGLMHGPAYTGDGAAALRALADDYERRFDEAVEAAAG
ncbi:MAG TPA: MBL fold metallo-hydrolase [Acidimicrobiales bacterium]|jgi:flavorubredoxin|nr:MBL fold metallo-hydrolase [Acidimicrobiales bacterium]